MRNKKNKPSLKARKRSIPPRSAKSRMELSHEPKNNGDEMIQVLNPQGQIVGASPDIPTEMIVSAYRNMVLTRMLDEKLVALQRQGRMGTYVSCSGQEASQVGTVLALSKRDWIFPMYRDLGMIVQAGVSVRQLMNRMLGNAEDEALGRDLPNLFAWKPNKVVSFAAPIASHVPLATGFAMAAKIRKDELVTVSTFGDGATSSGEFHVAMNFAGVFAAPTVFVCENNQYAISVPVSQQTASKSIAIKAAAYGFDGVRVDGNDLLAVYTVMKDAVEKARRGGGPTLVECVTYRMSSHSTADDWKKYRASEEVEKWKARDPILRVRLYLEKARRAWSDQEEEKLKRSFDSEIGEAISAAEKVPPPDISTMFRDVYQDIPERLKEDLRELRGS